MSLLLFKGGSYPLLFLDYLNLPDLIYQLAYSKLFAVSMYSWLEQPCMNAMKVVEKLYSIRWWYELTILFWHLMHSCFRHLIGFFLCLALTICITTKGPKFVDLRSLQHLPDLLKKTDLQRIQSELVACLPSLRHLSDLQRLKDVLKTSLASMDVLPSLSCWHLLQLLSNCLPLQIYAFWSH